LQLLIFKQDAAPDFFLPGYCDGGALSRARYNPVARPKVGQTEMQACVLSEAAERGERHALMI
jgi:hypothetical protein